MNGSGDSQNFYYSQIVNFGYMEYNPSGNGWFMGFGGSFINAPGNFFSAYCT